MHMLVCLILYVYCLIITHHTMQDLRSEVHVATLASYHNQKLQSLHFTPEHKVYQATLTINKL